MFWASAVVPARKRRWIRWLLAGAAALLLDPSAAAAESPAAAPASGQAQADRPTGSSASRSDTQAIEKFREAAESLYQAVNRGDRLAAVRSMKETETRLRELPMMRIATAEGIEALADSVAEMKRAMAAVTQDGRRVQSAAGAIRLAANALAEPQRPLWLQYRSVLREDVDVLAKALGDRPQSVTPEARAAFGRLAERYGLIRTAVALTSEPYVIERGDAAIRYAKRLLQQDRPDPKLLGGLIAPLREAMEGLFPPEGERPTTVPAVVPPSWGFGATIGSFIVAILTWAGWRRFRFDRTHPNYGSNRERRDPADRWFKSLLRLPGILLRARHARR